jgi:translation initiation factor 5A
MDMGDYGTIDVPITAEMKEKLAQGKEVAYICVLGRTKMDLR